MGTFYDGDTADEKLSQEVETSGSESQIEPTFPTLPTEPATATGGRRYMSHDT